MNRHLTGVDRYVAAARAAIAAQRAMLKEINPKSAEASNSRKLLAMSEAALLQILEHREFMARFIELCVPRQLRLPGQERHQGTLARRS
jgi:hypothetical protein